jgi:dTDP-4-dehydrorhamnose reductase
MVLLAGEKSNIALYLLPLLRNEEQVCSFDSTKGDLCNTAFIDELFYEMKPKVCINLEEINDYVEAEVYREKAYNKNSFGAMCLAENCRKNGVPLIHVSTTALYDQTEDFPKNEEFTVKPISVYTDSKLLGEQKIQQSGCEYTIVRLSDVYGRHDQILMDPLKKVKEKRRVTLIRDSKIMPVYALDAAWYIREMYRNNIRGIYNIAGNEVLTRYQFLFRFLDKYNEKVEKISPDVVEVDYDRLLHPVDLPRNNCADTSLIHSRLDEHITPIDDAVNQIIEEF